MQRADNSCEQVRAESPRGYIAAPTRDPRTHDAQKPPDDEPRTARADAAMLFGPCISVGHPCGSSTWVIHVGHPRGSSTWVIHVDLSMWTCPLQTNWLPATSRNESATAQNSCDAFHPGLRPPFAWGPNPFGFC